MKDSRIKAADLSRAINVRKWKKPFYHLHHLPLSRCSKWMVGGAGENIFWKCRKLGDGKHEILAWMSTAAIWSYAFWSREVQSKYEIMRVC